MPTQVSPYAESDEDSLSFKEPVPPPLPQQPPKFKYAPSPSEPTTGTTPAATTTATATATTTASTSTTTATTTPAKKHPKQHIVITPAVKQGGSCDPSPARSARSLAPRTARRGSVRRSIGGDVDPMRDFKWNDDLILNAEGEVVKAHVAKRVTRELFSLRSLLPLLNVCAMVIVASVVVYLLFSVASTSIEMQAFAFADSVNKRARSVVQEKFTQVALTALMFNITLRPSVLQMPIFSNDMIETCIDLLIPQVFLTSLSIVTYAEGTTFLVCERYGNNELRFSIEDSRNHSQIRSFRYRGSYLYEPLGSMDDTEPFRDSQAQPSELVDSFTYKAVYEKLLPWQFSHLFKPLRLGSKIAVAFQLFSYEPGLPKQSVWQNRHLYATIDSVFVQRFMRSLTVTDNAIAMLVAHDETGDGVLVGSSNNEPVLFLDRGVYRNHYLAASPNLVMKGIYKQFTEEYLVDTDWSTSIPTVLKDHTPVQSQSFSWEDWYVAVEEILPLDPEIIQVRAGSAPITSFARWFAYTAIPKEDLMKDVTRSWTIALMASAGITFLFCLLLLAGMSTLVTRPLADLAQHMADVADLDFSNEGMPHSRVKELKGIQKSFEVMSVALASFGKFVPMSVVKLIVSGQMNAELYVERRRISIFFSDIKGFTTLAESLSQSDLMMILQDYLDAMSKLIADSEGTISDFIGDGIMAFWNAPVDVPDHEIVAVGSALDQKKMLEQLNVTWSVRKLPKLEVRIGINSGTVLAGNVGSTSRMKCGAVGDDVNLASRLEGLNKRYGTNIMISDSTYQALRGNYACRMLERVVVKGRSQQTSVYEVMDYEWTPYLRDKAKPIAGLMAAYELPQDQRPAAVAAAQQKLEAWIEKTNDAACVKILELSRSPTYEGYSVLDEK